MADGIDAIRAGKPRRVFRFGPNELDLAQYELRRAGNRLPLARLPLELLIVLVERAGELVTREELCSLLWPDKEGVVDTRAGLNNAINRLRTVLNDDAEKPRYIETVFGKGYRFVAGIEIEEEVAARPGTRVIPSEAVAGIATLHEPARSVARGNKRGRWIAGALAAGLGICAALGGWWLTQHIRRDAKQFKATQFTTNDGTNRVNAAAISPSGLRVAYADGKGAFLRTISDGAVSRLPFPADLQAEAMTWTPNEDTLLAGGFRQSEKQWQIWSLRLVGGNPRMIAANARRANVSPDDRHIVFTNDAELTIEISDLDGLRRRPLEAGHKNIRVLASVWSDDGRHILSLEQTQNPDVWPAAQKFEIDHYFSKRLVARDAVNGQITAEERADRFDTLVSCSAGKLYLVSSHVVEDGLTGLGLWSAAINPENGAFASPPSLLIHTPDNLISSPSMAGDGQQVAALVEKGQADVYVADSTAAPLQNKRRLTLDAKRDLPNGWTPDGKAVIFESDRSGPFHLYRQALDSSKAELLTDMPGQQVSSVVTADGKWLLFREMVGNEVTRWEGFYRMPIGGGTPVRVPLRQLSDEVRCATLRNTCV